MINGVNGSNEIPWTTCALNIISPTPIVDMIDDSFIKVTNSFPSAGNIFLKAWGNMIWIIVFE